MTEPTFTAVRRLMDDVLLPLKRTFVGKDEIVDLLGVCLVARENLFLLGPPGTAKSALVRELARRIDGRVFDYLLTRFTEPNELFGPFDIRRLREGELVTNTEGMLPEADFVFLDELLNANSAILNSLLMALNERVFRRGRETRELPALMFVGASNRLPEEESLTALFDRFLMRVPCNNIPDDRLSELLLAGWKLDLAIDQDVGSVSVDHLKAIQRQVSEVALGEVSPIYIDTIRRLRRAGIEVSDRRAVKLQRLVAASALICARAEADVTDLWVLRYIWDTIEQQEIIASLVDDSIKAASDEQRATSHPRALATPAPDPEELARALQLLVEKCTVQPLEEGSRWQLRDQLSHLAGRCQWVTNDVQREHLVNTIDGIWQKLDAPNVG